MINNNMFNMMKTIFTNPEYTDSAVNLTMKDVTNHSVSVGITGPNQNSCNTWALKNRTISEILNPEVFDEAIPNLSNNSTGKPLSLEAGIITYEDFSTEYSLNNGVIELITSFTVTNNDDEPITLLSAIMYSSEQRYFTYDSSYGDWNPTNNNALIAYLEYNFTEPITLNSGESKTITLKESLTLA